MRQKKEYLVVTFATTTRALAMEEAAKEYQIPGRLIPLPSSISAGCGLAWRTEPEAKEAILQRKEIQWEQMHSVWMYETRA